MITFLHLVKKWQVSTHNIYAFIRNGLDSCWISDSNEKKRVMASIWKESRNRSESQAGDLGEQYHHFFKYLQRKIFSGQFIHFLKSALPPMNNNFQSLGHFWNFPWVNTGSASGKLVWKFVATCRLRVKGWNFVYDLGHIQFRSSWNHALLGKKL